MNIENINKRKIIKKNLLLFSLHDQYRFFSFTSGHIGAFNLNDNEINQIEFSGNVNKKLIIITKEFLLFLIFLLLPIKIILIFFRTLIRASNKLKLSHDLTNYFVSIGNTSPENDAYFSEFINKKNIYNFIYIASGFNCFTKDFNYIESFLDFKSIFYLFLILFFYLIFTIFFLFRYIFFIIKSDLSTFFFINISKELRSGELFKNIILKFSFDNMCIREKISIKKIIFPMEGRNWEKNLVESSNLRKIQSVGYVHCALTDRHQSLHNPEFYNRYNIPTRIVANSIFSFRSLKNNFIESEVIKGFFTRSKYKYTANISDEKIITVALNSNLYESKIILDRLSQIKLPKKWFFCIRLNPNTKTFYLLKKKCTQLNFKLFDPNKPFLPNICLYRSSSVALDYLSHNVPVYYLNICDIFENNFVKIYKFKSYNSIPINDIFDKNILRLINNKKHIIRSSKYLLRKSFDYNDLIATIN